MYANDSITNDIVLALSSIGLGFTPEGTYFGIDYYSIGWPYNGFPLDSLTNNSGSSIVKNTESLYYP